ncbi:hypothetical protein ACIRD3_08195 [Kitasatospora sp. NPDC093550]|uniref:hypothetical protein n=1 Tax=Kitasatospora sp. NPDC093550 TaxID=3364089 RepID=UPI003811A720
MNRTTVGGPELGGGRGAGGVLVLVDPSGAGNSPVAELLTQELNPSVHLRTDDFQRVIRSGRLPAHLPEAGHQNATALAAAAQAAFAYATRGYQVVVESPAALTASETFRRESRATGAALHYVVLHSGPAPAVDPAHILDTTGLTPETAAKSVLSALTRRTHLLGW